MTSSFKNIKAEVRDESGSLLSQKRMRLPPITWKTYVSIFLSCVFAILAAGPISAFPTLEPMLVQYGLFADQCPEKKPGCNEQGVRLQVLYNVGVSVTLGLSVFIGLIFDKFGPRVVGVVGAIGVSMGMVLLWAAMLKPELNWLVFIAFPLTDASGGLNSMSLVGFIWHFPKYQALVIGIALGSYQVSSILAIVLQFYMDTFHLDLGQGFLIFAGMAGLSALVLLFTIPRQQEFFDRAALGTGEEQKANNRNIFLLIGDSIDIFMQRKLDLLLFFIYIMFVNLCFGLWTGQLLFYLKMMFPTHGDQITFAVRFVAILSMSGVIITPILGLIMDRIGFIRFQLLVCVTISAWLVMVMTNKYYLQFISLIVGNFVLLTWSTATQRWVVYYIPPALIGTGGGVLSLFLGLALLGINSGVPYVLKMHFENTLLFFRLPYFVYGGGTLMAGIVLFIHMYFNGVPKVPPQPRRKCCLCCAGWGEEEFIVPVAVAINSQGQDYGEQDFSVRPGEGNGGWPKSKGSIDYIPVTINPQEQDDGEPDFSIRPRDGNGQSGSKGSYSYV